MSIVDFYGLCIMVLGFLRNLNNYIPVLLILKEDPFDFIKDGSFVLNHLFILDIVFYFFFG